MEYTVDHDGHKQKLGDTITPSESLFSIDIGSFLGSPRFSSFFIKPHSQAW